MKIRITLLLSFTFYFSTFSQSGIPSKVGLFIDTLHQKKVLGFTVTNDSLNTLSFKTISKSDFDNYRKNYKAEIKMDENRIIPGDTAFRLKTQKPSSSFRNNKKNAIVSNTYLGFIDKLSLFAIDHVDGYNATQELQLIDQRSGKTYGFASAFDNGLRAPLLSPDGKFLLAYSNNVFNDNECFISILRVNTKNTDYLLEDYLGLLVNKWEIQEIVWINGNSIALFVKEEDLKDKSNTAGKHYFLKAKLAG
ncbi:MAG: hypothetical protein ACJ76F_10780 [Bacteroidia bacterium]